MATEKIIVVDRIPEKLSDEEMKRIREEYAQYCIDTYKNVQDFNISSKDAKDIVFEHLLSPFQYFIEDKVRLKRLAENRLEAPQQQRPQGGGGYSNTPRGPVNNAAPQTVPEYKKQWKTRY